MPSDVSALHLEGLSKAYRGRVAVAELSLEVRRGEVFGLLGPNGAGKTTTIAMILGLVRPDSGRICILGHDLSQDPVLALSKVGAMIEAPAFYPYLSGYDNLRVLAFAGGIDHSRVDIALAAVELKNRAHDRFRVYSQGMKQRLAIAAALLADPELIMLDEPTNGLDPAGTVEMRHLIRQLADEGRTVLLCSHLLHEVEQICDRVAIMQQGRILARGRVSELLQASRQIQVRLGAADAEQALMLLQALDWVSAVEMQSPQILLVEAPPERSAELNAALTGAGLAVAELRTLETSLEAFFLEVTAHPQPQALQRNGG